MTLTKIEYTKKLVKIIDIQNKLVTESEYFDKNTTEKFWSELKINDIDFVRKDELLFALKKVDSGGLTKVLEQDEKLKKYSRLVY